MSLSRKRSRRACGEGIIRPIPHWFLLVSEYHNETFHCKVYINDIGDTSEPDAAIQGTKTMCR